MAEDERIAPASAVAAATHVVFRIELIRLVFLASANEGWPMKSYWIPSEAV